MTRRSQASNVSCSRWHSDVYQVDLDPYREGYPRDGADSPPHPHNRPRAPAGFSRSLWPCCVHNIQARWVCSGGPFPKLEQCLFSKELVLLFASGAACGVCITKPCPAAVAEPSQLSKELKEPPGLSRDSTPHHGTTNPALTSSLRVLDSLVSSAVIQVMSGAPGGPYS